MSKIHTDTNVVGPSFIIFVDDILKNPSQQNAVISATCNMAETMIKAQNNIHPPLSGIACQNDRSRPWSRGQSLPWIRSLMART